VHGPVAPRPAFPRSRLADRPQTGRMIDRRTFLAGTGAVLLATSLGVEAQQAERVYRVGILGEKASDPSEARLWQVFRSESSWFGGSRSQIPAPKREAGP
jgi:hypothetical protein